VTHERFIEVTRTARLCTLGEPGPAIRQVWLVCHGYAQLAARFLRRFAPLDDGTCLVVAPEALNRFYVESSPGPHGPEAKVGATWMTREDRLHEIDDYCRYLDRVHDVVFTDVPRDGVRLVVLGFSQGMSTVVRWAARTTARIDRLVLWAGTWAQELVPSPDLLHGARLTLVAGRGDPSVSEASIARMGAMLESGGLDHELLRYDGGHVIDAGMLRAIARSTGSADAD
jgi:predicted esterase